MWAEVAVSREEAPEGGKTYERGLRRPGCEMSGLVGVNLGTQRVPRHWVLGEGVSDIGTRLATGDCHMFVCSGGPCFSLLLHDAASSLVELSLLGKALPRQQRTAALSVSPLSSCPCPHGSLSLTSPFSVLV